jgi:hypothetical protein
MGRDAASGGSGCQTHMCSSVPGGRNQEYPPGRAPALPAPLRSVPLTAPSVKLTSANLIDTGKGKRLSCSFRFDGIAAV